MTPTRKCIMIALTAFALFSFATTAFADTFGPWTNWTPVQDGYQNRLTVRTRTVVDDQNNNYIEYQMGNNYNTPVQIAGTATTRGISNSSIPSAFQYILNMQEMKGERIAGTTFNRVQIASLVFPTPIVTAWSEWQQVDRQPVCFRSQIQDNSSVERILRYQFHSQTDRAVQADYEVYCLLNNGKSAWVRGTVALVPGQDATIALNVRSATQMKIIHVQ